MVVILAGIHSARGVLGPLFLATFFAALLNTPVNWLKDRGFKQWLALTIVIIGVAVVGLSSMTIIGTQIAQFARNIPEYRDRFNETLEGYNLDAGEIFPFLKSDDEKEKEKPAEEEEAKEAYLNELRWRDEYERSKNADADVAKKSKSDSEQKSQDKGEAPRGNLSESERAGLNAATIMPVSLTTDELFPDMETAIPASDLPQNEAAQPQQRPVPRDPQPTAAAQELAPDGSEGLIPGDPPAFRSHDDEVVKDVENALAETFNVDAANGTNYVSTDLVLQFNRMETTKRVEMTALAQGELCAIVEDMNGKFWYLGKDEPVSATAGDGNTGSARSDGNRYTLTLQDVSATWPLEIAASAVTTDIVDTL